MRIVVSGKLYVYTFMYVAIVCVFTVYHKIMTGENLDFF